MTRFTASSDCVPDGPHFDYEYYVSFNGLISAVIAFVAIWLYQMLFSQWKFRTVLIFTTLIDAASSIFDVFIVYRWNISLLGIGDKAFYMIGSAIVENVIAMLYWIPASAIIGKVSMPGMESAIYAFIAGCANFGR